MTQIDDPLGETKRHFRKDLAVCIKCGHQIVDGSISPFCEECVEPNAFLDREKFKTVFGLTPEEIKASCREPEHNGFFPTPAVRASWDAPFCPWCGALLAKPDST